jgi:hypothetical protein
MAKKRKVSNELKAKRPEDAAPEKRYSPAECIGCQRVGIVGSPKESLISTSHVERQNLTMRMTMR